MKNKKWTKEICLMAIGLGLVLIATAPALADQIVICQNCTSAPGGDPNPIFDPAKFNVLLAGSGSTVAPTLIVIAEYNGIGTPTVSCESGCASVIPSVPLATVGTFGLTANSGVTFNSSSSGTIFSALGLNAGGSLSWTNLVAGDVKFGIAAPTSFTLYAFAVPAGLSPLQIDTTAHVGSWIAGYGCQETTTSGTQCPSGDVSQSVNTNSGVLVPEPASLLLLGAGLAGIGIWRRKSVQI